MKKLKTNLTNAFLDFFEILLITVFVFILVYLFVAQLLEVDGDSMLPNFHDRERIVAEKVSKSFSELKRGEVLILRHPKQPEALLIKRLVGLPNETIKISQGHVFINGKPLEESYLTSETKTHGGNTIAEDIEYKIAENAYVFMGDNREHSTDSRSWGAVPENLIVGRGVLVYHPIGSFRFVK